MAQQPDLPGPSTSYSDPIYDRLEVVAQRIVKRLWLIVVALVAVIVIAVVTHASLRHTPIAASASQFLDAATIRMEADRGDPAARATKLTEAAKAFAAVAADEKVTPYYRARAYIELTQLDLDRSQLTEAKAAVEKAREFAAKAEDPDLELTVGLSEAAVLLQTNEHQTAETRYLSIERAAGQTYPDRQIAATLGAAQAMIAQKKTDEAIAKLETLINRTDTNASMLLALAKNQYWALKRAKAAPAAPVAPAAAGDKPAVPSAEQPAATPVAPTAAPAPSAVAPTTPAAAAPVAPTPAPGPEGK